MWPSIRGVGATFFFEHLIDVFCYLLSFCYLLAEWLAVNTRTCTVQTSGHVRSQWSLLWWLLKGEPISWFPPSQCCDKIQRSPLPCTEMFLITLYLSMERNMVPFLQLLLYTQTRTHAHTCTHSFVQVVFSMSVWVSLFTQYLFPSELWMEGNFSNQIIFSDRRPGNWGRVWKEGKARKERALNWKNNFPTGAWAWGLQRLSPPIFAGGHGTLLVSICVPYKPMYTETHTSIHPSVYAWFGMSRSIVLRGSLFLFFFSHYTLKIVVSYQTNKKLFWKTLHTPFLSSALKYRLNTHILPVFLTVTVPLPAI